MKSRGFRKLHAPFLKERRTRNLVQGRVQEIRGISLVFREMLGYHDPRRPTLSGSLGAYFRGPLVEMFYRNAATEYVFPMKRLMRSRRTGLCNVFPSSDGGSFRGIEPARCLRNGDDQPPLNIVAPPGIESFSFGAIATESHVAPSSRVVPASIQEKPPAGFLTAFANVVDVR